MNKDKGKKLRWILMIGFMAILAVAFVFVREPAPSEEENLVTISEKIKGKFLSLFENISDRENIYPDRAIEFIGENYILEPIYNAYNKETIFREFSNTESTIGVGDILERYQANALIIDRQEESFLEFALLAQENWSLVYFDELSILPILLFIRSE